ncbi:MAG: hypothetical protein DRG59_11460 [Deltaproteobacteria bacterium]|nr:MAG: hypothetical protein DRG59_11460 [Deltaproteobacteria bacterium]
MDCGISSMIFLRRIPFSHGMDRPEFCFSHFGKGQAIFNLSFLQFSPYGLPISPFQDGLERLEVHD